jgi:ABC-type sugar transport system substrate-binding protein
MSSQLGADGIVAHVEGNPADAAGAALTQGFTEGLAENGINEIVAMAPSDWDREKGLAVATDMLTAHPDLQGLYGANDDVAMGALQALNAAGRTDVLLAGHNGTCEALASILQDKLDFTVMLFNRPLGSLMVDTAVQVLNGETVPANMAAPVLGIDAGLAAGVLDGSRYGEVPENIAPEVKERLEAAKSGCS